MASLRQIKRRIKTAKNIAQITKAMEMVAASKMKRAQNQALASKPYAEKLYAITGSLVGIDKEASPPLLANIERAQKNTIFIIVAPEKGLCGSLVSNLGKEFNSLPKDSPIHFITIGKKARDLILRINGQILAHFELGLGQPKFEIVPPIVNIITEKFIKGEINKVFSLYTDFVNTIIQRPVIKQLLPVTGLINSEEVIKTDFQFEPSPQIVLESLLPHYLEMEIYQIVLEAYASEQSARMIAMKNATDNASEITQELTLVYNKLRQAAITNEIADIVTASLTL